MCAFSIREAHKLTGALPTETGLVTNQIDWMVEAQIHGTIPSEVGQLYLQYNSLTGQLPTEIGLLEQLRLLAEKELFQKERYRRVPGQVID